VPCQPYVDVMIELRYPTLEDAEPLTIAVRESLPELKPWMDWAEETYDVELARAWIGAQAQSREAGRAFEFLVTGPDGTILGACGINRISPPPLRLANVGYWIRSSVSGRGIACDAVRRLAHWALSSTRLNRLEIVVAVGNYRSRRVAEKVGAQFEGILRARLWTRGPQDAFMYSLIRSQPRLDSE
jgi:RimJ/RimL family protein N-acetyltransferase